MSVDEARLDEVMSALAGERGKRFTGSPADKLAQLLPEVPAEVRTKLLMWALSLNRGIIVAPDQDMTAEDATDIRALHLFSVGVEIGMDLASV